MSENPTPEKTDPAPEPTKDDPKSAAADEPLGEPGKKALEAERDARKNAESQLAALRGEFDTFKTGLTEALGVKPKKGDDADALTQVQEQLARMQRDNSVLALANEHKITDKEDLDLLRSTTDEQARIKLATRLAAKADETPGTPKPDTTQGAKGEVPGNDPGPGLARLRHAYASPE